jgi:hypothetical protein
MSIKSKQQQSYSSTPTFQGEGREVLNSLQGLFDKNPLDSEYGKFFLTAMRGDNALGDQLKDQIGLITARSDAALPKELAASRSFTRNRPDTFQGQVADNTVADNRIGRDLQIAQLLREQGNLDRATQLQAGSTVAGLDANRFGQGATLLSMLRGEQGTGQGTSSTFNPYQTMSSVGGFARNMIDIVKPTK